MTPTPHPEDIVERLNDIATSIWPQSHVRAKAIADAADLIVRLRSDNGRLREELSIENGWFAQKHSEGLIRLTEDVRHRDDCTGWSANGPREKWCPHLEVLNNARALLSETDR